jgi:type II secretory pathway component PulM
LLQNREQRVLAVGGGAALLIFLFSFLVFPDIEKIRVQNRTRAQAEKDLAELRAALPGLRRLEDGIRIRRDLVRSSVTGQESPLSRLTARLQEAGFPQSAFSIKSGGTKDGEYFKEESFDIKIENRSFPELVQFLQKIEDGSMPVAIRSVNLKSRYENSSAIDAVLRVGYQLPR